ncbi:MAG: DNA polymerase III subunit delta [Candidatus Wildermuthbacteria bacterium]|nr:DNA polymerase III subunit delta [Candidatus Wildermuthbacteria bacterium]
MLYLLYGPDTFRSQLKLKEIVEEYGKKHGTSAYVRVCDGETASFEDLKREAETRSLFQEKKLIILKRACSNARFADALDSQKEFLLRSYHVFLFFEDAENAPKHSLWKFLLANAVSQKFELLKGAKLSSWVRQSCLKKGGAIAQNAAELLAERAKGDLWTIDRELSKLVAFLNADSIERRHIERHVRQDSELNIFAAIDEAANRRLPQALSLLSRHMEQGDSPLYLFSMLAFQFRNLLIVKSSQERKLEIAVIAKKYSLHPFVARKCAALSLRFSLRQLITLYQSLWKFDYSIKNGKIDATSAVYQWILQIPNH